MNVLICSVPVESAGAKLRRKRSEGSFPIMPKIACTSLNNWAEKNGFKCNYYDIDMLYPSDDEIEKYFTENPQDIVGLSAVTSTTYLQVKRLCKIIKKVNKKTTTQKDRSLRTIVQKQAKTFYQTDEAKVLSSLTGGP